MSDFEGAVAISKEVASVAMEKYKEAYTQSEEALNAIIEEQQGIKKRVFSHWRWLVPIDKWTLAVRKHVGSWYFSYHHVALSEFGLAYEDYKILDSLSVSLDIRSMLDISCGDKLLFSLEQAKFIEEWSNK